MIVIDNYAIVETSGCLQIAKWAEETVYKRGDNAGEVKPAGWEKIERYPHDIAHACRIIVDLKTAEQCSKAETQSLQEFAEWFETMLNSVCRYATSDEQMNRNK